VATQTEYIHGTNMAKAASATKNLDHFIWSTLPDRNAVTNGKFKVPHCDSKAQVDLFIKNDKALLAKTTFLWVGLFAATQKYPLFTPLLVVCDLILPYILQDRNMLNRSSQPPGSMYG